MQIDNRVEMNYKTSVSEKDLELVADLSEELLFTLENVERHATSLKQNGWMRKSRRQTLDQVLDGTRQMYDLLKELKTTVKP